MRKLCISSVSVSVVLLALSGCRGQLAVYDVPEIVIPYSEIVESYQLDVEGTSQFSTEEVEEIFNLVKTIRDNPTAEGPTMRIDLHRMKLDKSSDGLIRIMAEKEPGPPETPYSNGYFIFLDHRPDGRYTLVEYYQFSS